MSSILKPAALAVAVALVLVACKKPEPAAPVAANTPAAPAAPVLEGQLDILAWPGYVERGETDKAYDWVTEFEKATACKVNVTVAHTSDEMVDLVNAGGHDLVTASGDASLRLIAGGKVQAIDPARIPSLTTLDPRLQDAPWHTVGGKHYGVPFQWGPNVLMYNTKVFPTPPTSWSVVFEAQDLPDGKPNKGRVQAFDGPIYIADAALYLMAKNPDLGITDPYALDETQYAAVLELLRKQKALVHRYWHDPAVQEADFRKEGIVASGSWAAQVNALQADGEPIASVIPAEGATGWADTTMLASDAKHPNCGYAWMEWSLKPKVQGDVAAFFGSLPVVPAACSGNALLGDAGCSKNGLDSFPQVRFWRTPEAKCAQGACVPYSRWTEDYAKLIGK
jgi:putative spermidine/putrescine transport system substrate-binding protein